MSTTGQLYLVSAGPGFAELIPPMAKSALEQSHAVVSYDLYLTWIQPWIDGKEVHTFPLTRERERASKAIELAREGRAVSLVSSGDIGVYGMAALVLEEMREDDTFALEIVPGISAANSCASLLGAPLSHDFATLSLSDLLCPWAWIEERARHLAQADLVLALYNVQSRQRQDGVYRILRILLESKTPGTWCGIVRNAYRKGQEVAICRLEELLDRQFDMLTTIIVGNKFTRRKREFIYTPRGYNAWEPSTDHVEFQPAVWVFSGTRDGNALACKLADSGYDVVVSAATEYGRELVTAQYPGLSVRAGRMGVEARRRELLDSGALAIVDATHPFATEISSQLMGLARQLDFPYLRYERPQVEVSYPCIRCRDMEEAAARANKAGQRIFLATGTKDLSIFLSHKDAKKRDWFLRITPDAASLQRALALGIPRARICAMQGPFSKEMNEALWQSWSIDCVVTKESGEAGGFSAKAAAAGSLGLPLFVVARPTMDYPLVAHDFDTVLSLLGEMLHPANAPHLTLS